MTCKICEHPRVQEINEAILNMNVREDSLELIAESFGVDAVDLARHAIMDISATPPVESLARQLKLKEADTLAALQTEYMQTVTKTGEFIRGIIADCDCASEAAEKIATVKLITKPMVDLYVGTGSEVRNTARTLADLKQILQGGEGGPLSGLAALAAAIQSSSRDNSP